MSAVPAISLAAVHMDDAAGNSDLSPLGSPVAVDEGSPIDTLQRTVRDIPCRATQTSLGLVIHMIHGIESNLLRLMQHMGVTPLTQHRLNMVSMRSSGDSSLCVSPAKPHCPLCRSSNFGCEKHFVQHLATAIENLTVVFDTHNRPSPRRCLFSPARHSEIMGRSAGTADANHARSFLTGFKNCFVASEVGGFDAGRLQNAADFLELSKANLFAVLQSADYVLGEAP